MNRITTVVITAALAVGLAGCGGSGNTGSAAKVDYGSAQSILNALDANGFTCVNWQQNKGVIGAREDWDCTYNGDTVSVTTFQSKAQKEDVKKAFASLQSGINVEGDTWMVNVPTQDEAEQVHKILGGTVS